MAIDMPVDWIASNMIWRNVYQFDGLSMMCSICEPFSTHGKVVKLQKLIISMRILYVVNLARAIVHDSLLPFFNFFLSISSDVNSKNDERLLPHQKFSPSRCVFAVFCWKYQLYYPLQLTRKPPLAKKAQLTYSRWNISSHTPFAT